MPNELANFNSEMKLMNRRNTLLKRLEIYKRAQQESGSEKLSKQDEECIRKDWK